MLSLTAAEGRQDGPERQGVLEVVRGVIAGANGNGNGTGTAAAAEGGEGAPAAAAAGGNGGSGVGGGGGGWGGRLMHALVHDHQQLDNAEAMKDKRWGLGGRAFC